MLIKGVGGGWSRVKSYNFSCFDICYSPDFLVFRMGSFVSQLAPTHHLILFLAPGMWTRKKIGLKITCYDDFLAHMNSALIFKVEDVNPPNIEVV